ncbi:MAG: hypothetical protein M1537_04455 [Nitrospirae bacterium]|nr:hypothetical protein [Nitrospirota bacterium]
MTGTWERPPFLVRIAVSLIVSLLFMAGESFAASGNPPPTSANPGEEQRRLLLMRQDLDRDIERNRKILGEIDKKLELYRSLRKKNVRRLIRLYESMAPRTAASQINAMPKSLRLTLFSGMNPRKASRIMQYVDPRVAAEISAQMAGDPPAQGGGR